MGPTAQRGQHRGYDGEDTLREDGDGKSATPASILPARGGLTTFYVYISDSLVQPPITFQPPPPPGSNGASSSASQSGSRKPAEKPAQPNLIQRYNLEDKVKQQQQGEDETSGDAAGKKAWSNSKDERQTLLQKRRDEMILAARRKMEAKIAAEKAASATGSQ